MGLASGKSGKLTRKCSPADTSLYLNADLGITSGRLYAKNDTQVEFLNFTGKTAISATEWQYTGLTRQLSTTAVPATSLGGGYTWLANQDFIHDIMHDQILDPSLFVQVTRYADATARNVAIPSPVNGMEVYLIAEGYFTDYVAGAWTTRASGAVANASTTVAGKVEIATQAEVNAGTPTGGTGAILSVSPDTLAVRIASLMANDSRTVTTATVTSNTSGTIAYSATTTFPRYGNILLSLTSASGSNTAGTGTIQMSPVGLNTWTDSPIFTSAVNSSSGTVVIPIPGAVDVRLKATAPTGGGTETVTVNATYYL